MTQTYRLHYAPDNASQIVRLVLEELGLPYDTLLVDRSRSAQRDPAYLALNPAGKIPALETPEGVISEVGAILLYLSETHAALAPAVGTPDRAAFLKWLFFTANTLHPDLAMQFYLHRYGPTEALDDMRSKTTQRLVHHLRLLNDVAGNAAWLGAEAPSVLDFYVSTCLRWCALYPKGETGWFNLSELPNLKSLAERIENRPSARAVAAAEGLGPTPYSAPHYANPPEGVAL